MRELLFQRLWQHAAFEHDCLETTCGKSVRVQATGLLNAFDGPDFSAGKILLNNKPIHGPIELHIRCSDWYLHQHHKDAAYNDVILHVCLETDGAGSVQCENKRFVPTVVLKPHLHRDWQRKLLEIEQQSALRCSGLLRNISPEVVEHQLRTAAILYFKLKREALFSWYDAHRTPSDAFLRMFWIGLCDALGVPANREPMRLLAIKSWDYHTQPSLSTNQCESLLSVVNSEMNWTAVRWKQKSGRPGNRASKRIQQAAKALFFLKSDGFAWFLHRSVERSMYEMMQMPFCVGDRGTVLIHTVLLPAMHILGELVYKPELQREAEQFWITGKVPVPLKMRSAFGNHGHSMRNFEYHPGLLPQYRHFCSTGRCNECYIFKNILRG
jgi:hypothetical protein